MIKKLVDLFYNLSKEHKLVMSFKYDTPSKGLGIGEEEMSQVFLEDPIFITDITTTKGTVNVSLNFCVMLTKQLMDNINVPYPTTEALQSIAEGIALNFIAKIRQNMKEDYNYFIQNVVEMSMNTLKYYTDNNADGVRVGLTLECRNEVNFCDVDEHFNPDKEFNIREYLPDVSTEGAEGCAVFSQNKLPTFSL